jgi:hypothetical protein
MRMSGKSRHGYKSDLEETKSRYYARDYSAGRYVLFRGLGGTAGWASAAPSLPAWPRDDVGISSDPEAGKKQQFRPLSHAEHPARNNQGTVSASWHRHARLS